MQLKYFVGIAAMLAACPVLGADLGSTKDGFINSQIVDTSTRYVACYVGAGITGAFVRDSMQVTSLMSLEEGTSAWGAEPNIGCDLLFSWGVLGIEGDYEFQSSKSSNKLLGLTGNTPFGDTWHINGRLGAYTNANHHTLLYVTGGYAGASSATMTLGSFSSPFSGPHGYDAGIGIETLLGKVGTVPVLAYGEYTHDWYDTSSSTIAGVIPTKLTTDVDRVSLGLRVKF